MINLNKKISFSLSLAISTAAFPMGYAKKTASAAGTVAHYTAAGWMLKEGIERLIHDEENVIEEYTMPAPEPLTDFVHGILRREKIPNPEALKVLIHNNPQSPYGIGKKAVYIDIKEAQQLAHAISSKRNRPFKVNIDHNMGCRITATWTPVEYIIRTAGILTHEAAHMRNHDNEKTTAVCFAIPILSLLLTRYKPILSLINHSVSSKILSGLTLNEINQIAFGAYSRKLEYQADDAITEKAEAVMFLRELHFVTHAYPPLPDTYEMLKHSHPDPRYRMTRIARRIQLSDDQE